MPATEGQRQLLALEARGSSIARKLSVSKQLVSQWRRGDKLPGLAVQAEIERKYNIPCEAWTRAPGIAPSDLAVVVDVAQTLEKRATGRASALQSCLAILDRLDLQMKTPGLSSSAQQRIVADQVKALALRVRLEREEFHLEKRIVLEHPFWARLRDAIRRSLAPYPEAARAVAHALYDLDAAGPESEGHELSVPSPPTHEQRNRR